MDCPFCVILKDKTERILKQTKYSFVVLSDPRLMLGHILVIPKRHVEKFSELNEVERKDLFDEAIRIEQKILSEYASGCDMSQHYRPFIKQSRLKVDHLHIHLRPREFEDELYEKVQKNEKELFTDVKKEELEKFGKLFS